MAASLKNVFIGLFVVAAISVIFYMLLFLHPKVGDNAKTLRVRFTDIDKVNIGTRVTFAGKPVGEVITIRELPEARTSRTSEHGEIYVYELILKVDSGVDIFNTDVITLRTSGLLGERNIEITPEPLTTARKLEKVEDEILYAAQTTGVEDTMKEIGLLSQKFGVVLEDVHLFMEDIKQAGVVAKVRHILDNVTELTDSLNESDKLKQTLDNFLNLSERSNQTWTTVHEAVNNVHALTERAGRSWCTLDQTLDNIHQVSLSARYNLDKTFEAFQTTALNAAAFTDKANQIIDFTREGRGSIGQLFMGDDFYLRLKSILHKGESVMNDINSYGILFHLNKRWQRLQARKLQLLQQLSTPNEFADYFNREMDEIQSSLSRVSLVLNDSECYPQSLIYNPDFTQRFSELLKRIEQMEESLKMYNEQVIDLEEKACLNPH